MEGEYAVKVSQKSPPTPPTLKQKVGGCQVITGTDPISLLPVFGSGVPAVQDLDTATVFLNGGLTPVLTGTFVVSSGD